ncbi:MAG: FAS1-like dehydratase domain-containing protein [Methylocella sp.]
MEDFSGWIGRSVTREDMVTLRLLAEYRATLEPFLFSPMDDGVCPPGFHWGLAPGLPLMAELGLDGSEAKGLFLPPVPLSQRMWAGGAVETFASVRLGMAVTRTATISKLKMREGRSGSLCFVSVTHDIKSGAELLVRERQDLLFREGKTKAQAAPAPVVDVKNDVEWRLEASAAMLFRFSAFTFNAHRVHYDLPYAMGTEDYGGLLVHGPLQAALLLNQAATAEGRVPARFEYRCLAPLVAGPAITVATARDAGGTSGRIMDRRRIVTGEAAAFR